jgi:hypothetical protein
VAIKEFNAALNQPGNSPANMFNPLNPSQSGLWFYVPGTTNFPSIGACGVEAGDLFTIKRITFAYPNATPGVNNVVPDRQGYLPHLAYYPETMNLGAPMKVERWKDTLTGQEHRREYLDPAHCKGACYDNDANAPPVYRLDRGTLYCRGPGQVSIEGGSGPGGNDGTLAISYVWWRQSIAQAARDAGMKGIVVPHTPAGPVTHRFTLWNAGGLDIAGNPIFVPVPYGAVRVFTPDAQPITASFGPGTYSAVINADFGLAAPLGPFTFVSTQVADQIIFEIDL